MPTAVGAEEPSGKELSIFPLGCPIHFHSWGMISPSGPSEKPCLWVAYSELGWKYFLSYQDHPCCFPRWLFINETKYPQAALEGSWFDHHPQQLVPMQKLPVWSITRRELYEILIRQKHLGDTPGLSYLSAKWDVSFSKLLIYYFIKWSCGKEKS